MKFRHYLAKETFKGKKKNTERGVEDLIDPDQRGNPSSAEVEPNILSLDKETVTPPEPVEEEPKEMSRRDIFSFGKFLDFGAAVEDEAQKSNPEQPPEPQEEEESELPDKSESSAKAETEEEPKKGFFKRLVSKFKSDPEDSQPQEAESQTEPDSKPDTELDYSEVAAEAMPTML